MDRKSGVTLIEMLIAMAILGIMFGVIAAFMAQQSRAVALSQAINEAEVTARVIAEAVAQDFQLAGSRAVRIGTTVNYGVIAAGGCDEDNRRTCVIPTSVASDGSITENASGNAINGYAIFYRTSLDQIDPNCRRVDVAFVDGAVYRSDVECGVGITAIDLDAALFATDVTGFGVRFTCSDASLNPGADPRGCYVADDYVRQAFIDVTVRTTGRIEAEGGMELAALTPNLRPSVRYSDTTTP